MKSSKKLFLYILLNIFISAITTLSVLWLWDNFLREKLAPVQENVSTNPQVSQTEALTNPPASNVDGDALIEIVNVYGVNDIETEVVVLKYQGEGELSLTGWKLKDEDGFAYEFPQLVLNNDGSVQVYTKIGINTVVDLYWGLELAIWNAGETVRLVDPNGKIQSQFKIP